MKILSESNYEHICQNLLEAICDNNYYSGSISVYIGDYSYLFTLSVIIYRKDEKIADLIPAWWEFHWYENDKEVLSDFTFEELKRVLTT